MTSTLANILANYGEGPDTGDVLNLMNALAGPKPPTPYDQAINQARGMRADFKINPIELALGVVPGPGMVRLPTPIHAYHGSPSSFSRFDPNFINSNTGATYRPGFHLTEYEPTAEVFAGRRFPGETETRNVGHMYEVGIHADRPTLMNDDLPLSMQTPFVKGALTDAFGPNLERLAQSDLKRSWWRKGQKLGMDDSTHVMHLFDTLKDQDFLKRELAQRGVHGYVYKNNEPLQTFRAPGEGSTNYLIWSPEVLEIFRKYGIAAPVAGGTLANALAQFQDNPSQ